MKLTGAFLLGIVIGWVGAFRFIHIWLNRGSVPYRDALPVEVV